MALEYLHLDPHNFWFKVFDSLSVTERVKIGGHEAFKIPLHEAVYLCQLLNPSKEMALQPNPYLITHANNNQEPVIIPPSCAPINTPHPELGQKTQLNPLFAPSLIRISSNYPEFFSHGEKFLIIHELGSESTISKIQENFINAGFPLSQLIIFDMPPRWYDHNRNKVGANKAYVAEPIMEYLASTYLREKGYLVDKFEEQLSGSRKYLDLFAIHCLAIQNILKQYGLTDGGLYLCELERPLWKNNPPKDKERTQNSKFTAVVIEAESSRGSESNGFGQLKIDLSYGEFNHGYIAAPFIEESSHKDEVGVITVTTKGSLVAYPCPKDHSDEGKSSMLLKRVERIVKLTLLKNIPLRKTLEILPPVTTLWDIYDIVDKVPLEQICKLVVDAVRQ